MLGYQFYCLDEKGKDHLVGILPERRFNPGRITDRSIMNWAREIIGNGCRGRRIHFIRVNLSTDRPEGRGLLKVHPEPRLARSNG